MTLLFRLNIKTNHLLSLVCPLHQCKCYLASPSPFLKNGRGGALHWLVLTLGGEPLPHMFLLTGRRSRGIPPCLFSASWVTPAHRHTRLKKLPSLHIGGSRGYEECAPLLFWAKNFFISEFLQSSRSNTIELCWCECCCSLLLIGGITLHIITDRRGNVMTLPVALNWLLLHHCPTMSSVLWLCQLYHLFKSQMCLSTWS